MEWLAVTHSSGQGEEVRMCAFRYSVVALG